MSSSYSVGSSNSSLDGSLMKAERSKAQKGKCLPCFTHISTGSCLYGDHCRFIHDHHVASHHMANTTLEQRNNVDHKIRDDPIYWPPAFHPSVVDEYTLDPKIIFHDNLRYKSVFSMWTYFVGSISSTSRDWPNYGENPMTKRERLPVFLKLADGIAAESKNIPSVLSYATVIKASAAAHHKNKLPRTTAISLSSKRKLSHRHLPSDHPSSFVDISPHHTARQSA